MHRLLVAIALLTTSLIMAAGPTMARELRYTKIYYPPTKTYYELINMNFSSGGLYMGYKSTTWESVRQAAQRMSFGGVQGDLARVTSPELDSWLRYTFRPERPTWFGLIYDCKTRTLQYPGGQEVPKDGYINFHPTNWGPRDAQNRPDCGRYAVTFYGAYMDLRSNANLGTSWALNTSLKYYGGYFVEYATGRPIPEYEEIQRRRAEIRGSSAAAGARNPEQDPQ